MFKYLYPLILLSSLLGAKNLSTSKIVPLNQPFLLTSSKNLFDTSLSYTHQSLLSCLPKLEAVYKVESSKSLKIIPKRFLQSSKNYNCSYKKQPFKFQTEKFKLLEYYYFKNEKILRLSFNDEVLSETVLDAIKLTKIDKLSKTNLKYEILQKNSRTLVLKINEHIGQNSIELTVNQKLKTTHQEPLNLNFTTTFNRKLQKVVLDKDKKEMKILDAPQMVALESGAFALRIFLDDTLNNNPENFIEIEGIDNFELKKNNYANYSTRQRFGVSNESYYYHDVISAEFEPNKSYRVTLKKGLKSYRELKADKHYLLKTKDRAKSIFFDDKKTYISNQGELGFSSVNVEKATLVVERILDDNIRYFLSFNKGSEHFIDRYTEEVFTKELVLDSTRNQVLKQKFLLSDLNSKKLPFGVYKITLRYSEKVKKETVEHASSKVLFLSDLGISLNLSTDEAFVSVLSLSKARPMEHTTIELYAKNNAIIGTATTNEDGIAVISKDKLLELKPVALMVRTKNDSNFLVLNKSISSPMPYKILKAKERFKAHIYFQSKIVRPASKINALITVKDRDFISANKLPIKIVFREQYGKVLDKRVYHTDGYGLIDFSYQLDNSDKRGNYTLSAFIGDKQIGKEIIKVEAFLPPKIENTLKSNKKIYQANELMELNISSAYLFGSPAGGLQGKVTLNARPIDFSHRAYANYTFVNNHLQTKNVASYLQHSENITLDAKGNYSMVLSSTLTQKVPSILEAMIGVTIMDDAQPVSNYKKVKIYPYKAMVGLKLNANSFEKGKKLEGKAILIDPLSGKLIKQELYAVIKEVKWHYDYSSGNYNWDKEVTVVDSFTINSNEAFSRPILSNGDYMIEVRDHLGGHSSGASFDVWWWSYSNISPKNDLKSVEIKFEDKLYSKGDELEVQIKSPILEGEILLTLESKIIKGYKLVPLHKGVAKVKMSLDFELKRGVYLHATAYRASKTSSSLIPFRAMGYKFIKPNREASKIKIKSNLPEVSKSNRTLKLEIKTDKPSKVLVSIVDRGILQLVEQKKPEIFNYFNKKPSKNIAYFDLYDQLISYVTDGKLLDFGAGDSLSKKRKHLAPDLGKRVKPFMIWSGIVDVSSKEKSLEIQIPEFNGRASVVMIAMNEDSIGVSEQDIKIRDDVMLKPSYPLYALAGDKIFVPLRIFNTTKEAKVIALSSKLSENLSFVLNETNITIPANSSKLLTARLNAHDVGEGKITLYAKYGNETVRKSVELPVYNPYAISTKTFKGIGNKAQTFTAPKEYANAKVLLTLSDNLIGALRDDLKYLVQYPYGCAEQTSSKLSAMHYAKAFLGKDRLVGESENFIRQGIKKLYNMQNYYGEFNYWKNGSYVHAYASLYAGQTLLELQRDGTEIPSELIKNTLTMLKSVATLNKQYKATYTAFHRLYAGFILAEHKALGESTANMLYEKKVYKGHFLATYYMSAILKMQGKDGLGDKLFAKNSYDLSRYAYKTYGNRTGNFESNVRDMLLHFLIKTKYFNKDAKDLMVVQKEFTHLYSTQTKAIALKAISAYLGKPTDSKLDIDVELNGEKENYSESTTFEIDNLSSKSITLTPKSGAMSYSIELIKHLPRAIKNKLSSKEELSIKREFIDENGDEVDLNNLIQGDKLYSKVTIVNYGAIKNVVVSQRVPACLTIENSNISKQKSKFKDININQEYREIRDDRVLHFINLRKKSKYNRSLKKSVIIENRGVIYMPFMATSVGECKLPALITEAMYDTRIQAYAKEAEHITVKALNSKKATPTTTVAPVVEESLSSKAKKLIKELYTTEMNSNDEVEFSKFFHYPMSLYFRTKNASKDDILKDKKSYFKDWSKRVYTNMEIDVLSSSKHKVELKIVFNYAINSGKKILRGESKHFLSVEDIGGEVAVTRVGLKAF